MNLIPVILPELILIAAACVLFLLGVINKPAARRLSAGIALAALVAVFLLQWPIGDVNSAHESLHDAYNTFRVCSFAQFIKLLSVGVGVLFVLMSWPSNRDATGNGSVQYDTEAAEFFALLLLSIAGIFIVSGANDIVLLFLGIELASIPTYIMVSVSRPLEQAQEAGVKYFFLGAMAAALMLFGFSYLYGTTGTTALDQIGAKFAATIAGKPFGATVTLNGYQMLAVLMLILGFAFKMAAVPLHFYAADVYQGAATPVTALLSFVPKCTGFVALIKILYMIGGSGFAVPLPIVKLIWIMAVLTMTAGNVLALLQQNVKRVLAYSSVAHSGYMLVGIATMVSASASPGAGNSALRAVLFYLAAYGIMNAGAFGVLMLLPAKPLPSWDRRPSTGSAETFDDIAGAGIEHPGLGLMLAVACFSLTGLPLTIGFFGKFYLIQAAWTGGMTWLVIIMMINAAISAGYYLRIVGTTFLKPEPVGGIEPSPTDDQVATPALPQSTPLLAAVALSCAGTLLFGSVFPATEMLNSRAALATVIDQIPTPPALNDLGPEPQSAAFDSLPRAVAVAEESIHP